MMISSLLSPHSEAGKSPDGLQLAETSEMGKSSLQIYAERPVISCFTTLLLSGILPYPYLRQTTHASTHRPN